MSYVEKNLVSGEEIILKGIVHWGIYIPGLIWLLIGALIATSKFEFIGILFIVIAFFNLLGAWMYSYSTELAITDKRVIAKTGLIQRHTIELLHSKVEGLAVDQGILGRMLNFGTVVVNGTGAGRTPIRGIVEPLGFRKAALTAIENKS